MTITVENSAVKRIQELRASQHKAGLMLRITVDGGGCSGFQYKMELTDHMNGDDQSFGNAVVTDNVSLRFLKGSRILFDEDLIGSEFRVENPNAVSGCGCGASFAV